ncbi:MAG: dihydroorotate dehydrogenase electron transfer subunit [bacterium]|jgi:dihydroorotate dehydrogenase electron transfer subunit|nr:dihydroorotate dehydrogenase electron transfer subunit [candidate division KSB1 bacterium]MDH7561028.1 dihydroorotate dehydrogenase electron transfer subunit [bacterium]
MPALHACPVTRNEQVSQTVFRLTLHAPDLALAAAPGQFVNIRIQEAPVPLWRRPLSVYSVDRDAGSIRLLFEVRGLGTRILAASRPGTTVDALGPLGSTFSAPPPETLPILVAGGLGIAPLHFWAEELVRAGRRPLLLFGARTAEALCPLDDLRRLAWDLRLATEDGTEGVHGMVTELLATALAERAPQQTMVYACGPVPMLREVVRICAAHGVDGQICLETLMACGFGACMGCAVPARGCSPQPSYKLVCKEGPVFTFAEVDLER